ncbi:MAG: hypothetical protein KF745_12870 [Phycisphaeraceae bacterium]|nr:hypothetical protein [Phycisphaeraceae bacterium]
MTDVLTSDQFELLVRIIVSGRLWNYELGRQLTVDGNHGDDAGLPGHRRGMPVRPEPIPSVIVRSGGARSRKLRLLLEKKYIEICGIEPSGKGRVYYQVTPAGRLAVAQLIATMKDRVFRGENALDASSHVQIASNSRLLSQGIRDK